MSPVSSLTTVSASASAVDEREYWAAKKAEKTKKMWEKTYSATASVMVENAPEFSSSDDSDDEDERVERKKKRSKKSKKSNKVKKYKEHKRSRSASTGRSSDST